MSKLCFLASKLGFDTHDGCMALYALDWDVKRGAPYQGHRVLIDQVLEPPALDKDHDVQVANMGFPGLYVKELPLQCCTPDYVLTTTQWGSVKKLVRIALEDGKLSLVNVDIIRSTGQGTDELASQELLAVTPNGGAVISESAPNCPAIIGSVSPAALSRHNVSGRVEATVVADMGPISASSFCPIHEKVISSKLNFMYDILTIRPEEIECHVGTPVQWILYRPKPRKDGVLPPLIVVPHGGPHSCSPTLYSHPHAFLCASGYAVLMVNYRGSTGFGQHALEALPGNVGKLDVQDVIDAVTKIADSEWIDANRVGICGGSHGGFLAAHCLGRYPELFKAGALRNPVINIASMVTTTDIPDWCFVETLGCGSYKYNQYRMPNQKELNAMWEASPAQYASKVVTPTLVALGMSDRRVPASQGLDFYYTLRANGVKSKLLMYDDDNHAIDQVCSEADHWINIKRWFDEYLCNE